MENTKPQTRHVEAIVNVFEKAHTHVTHRKRRERRHIHTNGQETGDTDRHTPVYDYSLNENKRIKKK